MGSALSSLQQADIAEFFRQLEDFVVRLGNHDESATRALMYTALAALPLLLLVLSSMWKSRKQRSVAREMAQRAANKLKARDAVVHKVLDVKFDPLPLTFDARTLRAKYYREGLSCAQVTWACIQRSRYVGRDRLNAVTEEFYDEAFTTAIAFDKMSKDAFIWGLQNKPLWGVPISIKDCITQKDADCTSGSAARCFKPAPEDGLLVKLLRNAGAIVHVRSNIPQLLLMPDSDNAVWGRTDNPWGRDRTCGGSSGGEAALIASGCSFMGLGSDIGGSIRTPANYCGICGFKPTPLRVTAEGLSIARANGRTGQVVIKSTVGPMARSVADIKAMMRALACDEVKQVDKSLPIPIWNSDLAEFGPPAVAAAAAAAAAASTVASPAAAAAAAATTTTTASTTTTTSSPGGTAAPIPSTLRPVIRIGVYTADDWFEPCRSVQRALLMARSALGANPRFEVVDFSPKTVSTWEMMRIYFGLLAADGNWYSHIKALEGEELFESYKRTQKYTNIPHRLRGAVATGLRLVGEHRKAHVVEALKSGGFHVREYWDLIADMKAFCAAFTKEMTDLHLDGLLMPCNALVAPLHGESADLLYQLSYTFLANMLHFPAGNIPVTVVSDGEADYDLSRLPPKQRDSVAKLAHKCMVGASGMPVGVQVMTHMWQDELCTFIMGEIEKDIRFSERHICPEFEGYVPKNADSKVASSTKEGAAADKKGEVSPAKVATLTTPTAASQPK